MSEDLIVSSSPFEILKQTDSQGDYWLARQLMTALGYQKWQDSSDAIDRAMHDCLESGRDVERNFTQLRKVSGKRGPAQLDYRLTYYACHLVVMAAQAKNTNAAALARTYFSDKVGEAESADLAEWRDRAIRSYVSSGYSIEYSTRRVDGIMIREKLTHQWSVRGIEEEEYPILTNTMHMGMFGLSISEHKGVKGFDVTYKGKRATYKQDLRPSMTMVELAIVGLGESVAHELHVIRDSQGFPEIDRDVQEAGKIAGEARERIEQATGRPVVSERDMVKAPDGQGIWGLLEDPNSAE